MASIIRVDDRSFCFVQKDNTYAKFKVKSKSLDQETSFHVANKAIQIYARDLAKHSKENFKSHRFSYGNRRYIIVPKKESHFGYRLLRIFQIHILHRPVKEGPKTYTIKKTWSFTHKKVNVDHSIKAAIGKKREQQNYLSLTSNEKNITPQDYAAGVRGRIFLKKWDQKKLYQDPFTNLATSAFIRFENHFHAHDNFSPFDCDYRLIQVGQDLMLVKRESQLVTEESKQKAVDTYLAYLKKTWGEEKITYIDHLYSLNLKTIHELTPEHIFRINIGTRNFEIQDVEAAQKACNRLLTQTSKLDGKTSFSSAALDCLPLHLIESIEKHLKKTNQVDVPTIEQFRKWMKDNALLSLDKFSQKAFNQFLILLQPTKNEQEAAFTGRKIFDVIHGHYTSGALSDFKPWIDQQELIQVFPRLIEAKSFEEVLELFSVIVSKKHLAKSRSEVSFQVGSLIPIFPKTPSGQVRWYKVSRCITNEYTFIYTLVSACNDRSLPDIEIHRPTASSSYALYSRNGIINDLNMVNPPGYMGIHLLDHLEKKFYKDKTIPLFVGYQMWASQELAEAHPNQKKIFQLLSEANQSLKREVLRPYNLLSFRDVIKKHDVILNKFYYRSAKIIDFEDKLCSKPFLKLFKKLVNNYIQIDQEAYARIPNAKIQRDALSLKNIMNGLRDQSDDSKEIILMKKLIKDLDHQILSDKALNLKRGKENAFDQKYAELELLKSQTEHDLNILKLKDWSKALYQIAKHRKENVEAKKAKSLVVTGHSLGGGSAQVAVMRYITNKERLPIPGQFCQLAHFDAPGIESEDNKRYKEFLIHNKDLLKQLKSSFKVFLRCEVGDIVFGVGDEHVGATFSNKEKEDLNSILEFDAAINKRLKSATTRVIAESHTVHETLFLSGSSVKAQLALNEKSIVYEKPSVKKGDYIEIAFATDVLGVYNSRGKKGEVSGKKGKKAYNDLNAQVWKLSSLSFLTEKFRKSPGTTAVFIRRKILNNQVEGRTFPDKLQDRYGRVSVAL